MCASSLLVTRMKRVIFLIPDKKYGRAWQLLKNEYYKDDASQYGQLVITGMGSAFADKVGNVYERLLAKIDSLRTQGIRDTHFLDFCRDELSEAFNMLLETKPTDLDTVNAGDSLNRVTLSNLQHYLNMPFVL